MTNRMTTAVLAAALTIGAAVADAAVLYGTSGRGGTASTLFTVDTMTGALSPVGAVGYAVSGMDYFGGMLYGVTSRNDPSFHGLITIDTTTGAGTPVGTGWGGTLVDSTIAGMAIDSSGNAYGWQEAGVDDLTQINLGTGLLSPPVGDAGIGTATLGLAFDLADNLHLINFTGDVYDVSTGTGAATFLGNIGTTAHHGDVDPDTGLYWGLDGTGTPTSLVSVNLGTLTAILGPQTAQPLHTLAFVGSAPPPQVPLPAAGWLVLTAFGGLGALRLRARRG